ncbi:hypothetical protein F7018_16890 [Tenacibaculum aiptasiae]|uniref:Bacteriocin n=1 Tax=Tenacibaculum aiptasiae TaxID=426481 RepID=A0A7J5A7B3_9FLAO|nr:hypothetical protein [Tenacibaculum aiptasiae]KAB1153343.1 hypothetical protein F7018_16890 [Tenacibaculum aiptasiae]
MKDSILNIGKALNRESQKEIFGGNPILSPIKFKCLVSSGDKRCCTPSECGDTGGIWRPNAWGYGTSANCICF